MGELNLIWFSGEQILKLFLLYGVSKIGFIEKSLKGEIIFVKYSLENIFFGVAFLKFIKKLYLHICIRGLVFKIFKGTIL